MKFNAVIIISLYIGLVSAEDPLYQWRTIGFGDLMRNGT